MRSLQRGIVAAMALAIFAVPTWGDVIGSRTAKASKKSKATVTARLHALGVHPVEAQKQVRDLHSRDLEYFASDPSRIVLAGAQGQEFFSGSSETMWYEFVIGVGAFLLPAGIIGFYVFAKD